MCIALEFMRSRCPSVFTRLSRICSATGLGLTFALSTFLRLGQAEAYSTKTLLSDPCHEEMTFLALQDARKRLDEDGRIEVNANEQALLDDVPFPVDAQHVDLGAISLVLGNRWNDFKSFESNDLNQLAPIHGNPDTQPEHCLRKPGQDGVAGSHAALAACRDYITAHVDKALEGLAADGTVDAEKRTVLKIALDLRGPVEASLPLFYVEMGHALHAIQDGFSHTYRTADHMQVLTVLDYVETVEDTHQTKQDGPRHLAALDECTNLDEFRTGRLQTAMRASSDFLMAVLDRRTTIEQRREKVAVLLDRYFTHAEACGDPSGACGAEEDKYRATEGSCAISSNGLASAPAGAAAIFLGAVVSAALGRRAAAGQRRARLGFRAPVRGERAPVGRRAAGWQRARKAWMAGAALSVTVLFSSLAMAAEEARPMTPPVDEAPGTPWGVAAHVSGSFDNPALAAGLGVRFRVSQHFLLGIDGEYNPWFAQNAGVLRPGVASAYASFIFRVPLAFERINLRSTLQLGASRMMFDLYGVPEGSIGPYLGINLLGLDYELGKQFYLTFDPAHIVVPMPQIAGVPFANPQYRITLGLQWGG